ncbi:MAG TPA: glycosyltransferase family 39 protein [Rubrobacter sp.]|nr:glycosyltransferase family 39 protein [Rubrobacter sp.]
MLRTGSLPLLPGLAFADFVAHMLVSNNYGYFRDELYYIEAGRHLAFGYVDFPPLIALIAKSLDLLAGDALWAMHVVPALATALIVLITGLMARELGGGRFAVALAGVASLVAVTFLATGALFSMDALDELWWVFASYVLVLILKRGDGRLWLLFGLVAGVDLATKVSMLFLGLAAVVGLLLTPHAATCAGSGSGLGARSPSHSCCLTRCGTRQTAGLPSSSSPTTRARAGRWSSFSARYRV